MASSGGGGNRTRVPRHFHASFYVCSRWFEGSRDRAPIDRVPIRLSENLFSRRRARRDARRSGITADFWASPAKSRSRGRHC